MNRLTFFFALFCVVFTIQAQDSTFELVEYRPAPGQHINKENIGTPQSAQDMVTDEKSLVSLGNFGGYIVLKFNKACENHPQNPYGIDFSVFGNAFPGSSEPGIVHVMQDENKNGVPDDTWYEIAGSEYFNPATNKNYKVRYKNPHGAFNIPWKDNSGNEGEIIANSFHTQEYYPSSLYFTDYPQDSVVFEGTKLQSSYYETSKVQIELEPLAFGYADNLPTKNYGDYSIPDNPYTLDTIEGGGGNAIDISWAIDSEGNYVDLDSINFVKIVSANLQDIGVLGELSSDVAFIHDVKENSTISGNESVVVVFNHAPEVIVGDSVYINSRHFELGKPSEKNLSYNIESGDALITDENYVISSVGGNVTIRAQLNEDISQYNTTTVFFREPSSIQLNSDLSTLYPGDTIMLDASVLDQNDVTIKSLNVSFSVNSNKSIKVSNEDETSSLIALNSGTDTLFISCTKYPDMQLKIPITVHEQESRARVYISIKTEDENILPYQYLDVPLFDLNPSIENAQNDYSTYTQPTIAHAICKGLEKAELAFSFMDDDKANGKLYLYSVEKEGLYTYGWGGKTDPSAYAKGWIVRHNGNSSMVEFDKTNINSGDTIILYHVSDLLTPWELTTLYSSSDTVRAGYNATISAKSTHCSFLNHTIIESSLNPIANKEVHFKGMYLEETLYTDENGEIDFRFNEAFNTRISSGNDALNIYAAIELDSRYLREPKISLYPNPTKDFISLKGNKGKINKIEIFNSNGILERSIEDSSFDEKINISELSRGMYLVKVVTQEFSHSIKISKN